MIKIGDRIRVTLSNGYVHTGTIQKLYKNGSVVARLDRADTGNLPGNRMVFDPHSKYSTFEIVKKSVRKKKGSTSSIGRAAKPKARPRGRNPRSTRGGATKKKRPNKKRAIASKRAWRTRRLGKTKLPKKLISPDLAKDLARAMGVTLGKVERWRTVGGTPRAALDTLRQLHAGEKPYREPKGGKGRSLERKQTEKLEAAMRRFAEAVRDQLPKEEISEAYRSWRRAKLPARRLLSRAAWARFVDRMGEELDLPDTGVFSKERFRKS